MLIPAGRFPMTQLYKGQFLEFKDAGDYKPFGQGQPCLESLLRIVLWPIYNKICYLRHLSSLLEIVPIQSMRS